MMNGLIVIGETGNTAYSVGAGTRNITISGLSFTLTLEQLLYVFNKTQNELYYAPAKGLAKCSVSGDVITFDSSFPDTLDAGDELHIQVWEPDRGVSADGYPMVHILNPEYAHYTSPEHLVDEEDQADSTINRFVIPFESYTKMTLQIKTYADTADDTVDVDIFYTNNEDADDSADTDWVSATTDVFGSQISTTNTTDEAMYIVDADTPVLKWMIKVEYTYGGGGSANNSCDVYIKKK